MSQVSHSVTFLLSGRPWSHDHISVCVLNATVMQYFDAVSDESVGLSVVRNQNLLQLHSFDFIHTGCESTLKICYADHLLAPKLPMVPSYTYLRLPSVPAQACHRVTFTFNCSCYNVQHIHGMCQLRPCTKSYHS